MADGAKFDLGGGYTPKEASEFSASRTGVKEAQQIGSDLREAHDVRYGSDLCHPRQRDSSPRERAAYELSSADRSPGMRRTQDQSVPDLGAGAPIGGMSGATAQDEADRRWKDSLRNPAATEMEQPQGAYGSGKPVPAAARGGGGGGAKSGDSAAEEQRAG